MWYLPERIDIYLCVQLIFQLSYYMKRLLSERWFRSSANGCQGKLFHEENHFGNQLLWFMTNLSHTLALGITLSFWNDINPYKDRSKWTWEDWFETENFHRIQVRTKNIQSKNPFFKKKNQS